MGKSEGLFGLFRLQIERRTSISTQQRCKSLPPECMHMRSLAISESVKMRACIAGAGCSLRYSPNLALLPTPSGTLCGSHHARITSVKSQIPPIRKRPEQMSTREQQIAADDTEHEKNPLSLSVPSFSESPFLVLIEDPLHALVIEFSLFTCGEADRS